MRTLVVAATFMGFVVSSGCSLQEVNKNVGVPVWGSAAPADPTAKLFTRQKAIETYLQGRDLSPVEGVWVWSDNQYEVAIFKNDRNGIGKNYPEYDFVGLITDSREADRDRRHIKLLLKETASPAVYSGIYVGPSGERFGTAFLMNNRNLIETSIPGRYGIQQKVLLLRMYPRANEAPATAAGASGTGFFIAPELVATNFHVVSGATQISLQIGQQKVHADLVIQDKQNDLALLRIRDFGDPLTAATIKGSVRCLELPAADDLKAGQTVFVLGYPLKGTLGSKLIVSQGIVNSTVGVKDDPTHLQISVPIQPGNSGSPLLDDKGRVVGIVTSELLPAFQRGIVPQNVNFAVKAAYLRALLAMAPNSACPGYPLPGNQRMDAQKTQELLGNAVVSIEITR